MQNLIFLQLLMLLVKEKLSFLSGFRWFNSFTVEVCTDGWVPVGFRLEPIHDILPLCWGRVQGRPVEEEKVDCWQLGGGRTVGDHMEEINVNTLFVGHHAFNQFPVIGSVSGRLNTREQNIKKG